MAQAETHLAYSRNTQATASSAHSLAICVIFLMLSISVFGLSLTEYTYPTPQIHQIDATVTAPMRRVNIPGKNGGIRYQMEISSTQGMYTAIIRNFELHKPEVQSSIQGLKVGSLVAVSFANGDFFTSPCDVWAIHANEREVLPLSASVLVKRTKEKRVLAFSGIFTVALVLWAAVMIRRRKQPR